MAGSPAASDAVVETTLTRFAGVAVHAAASGGPPSKPPTDGVRRHPAGSDVAVVEGDGGGVGAAVRVEVYDGVADCVPVALCVDDGEAPNDSDAV